VNGAITLPDDLRSRVRRWPRASWQFERVIATKRPG
jgi:hypothetical protein